MSGIYNFHTMTAFLFRRKILWMTFFTLGILALSVGFTSPFFELAGSEADLLAYKETLKNPAMIAMSGPAYTENYTFGVLWTQMMMVWLIILVGIMSIFFITSTTRRDEADGRLEVLASLPIGRNSVIFSSVLIMVIFNLIIGLLTGLGNGLLHLGEMDMKGSMIIGAAIAANGIFYGAVAAITSQLCETSRGANSLAILILGVGYMLRAMGDVQYEALNFLTPFGMAFKSKPFADNEIAPLFLIFWVAMMLLIVAFLLNHRRSMYAGYLPTRKGRRHAGLLKGPFSLGLRLMKNQIISWAIICMLLGASFGSIFGDLEEFFAGNEMMAQIISAGSGGNILYSFIAYINMMLSMIATIPVLTIINKLRVEEKAERLEQVYAKAVSKTRTLLSFALISFISSIIFQFCTAIGIYSAAEFVLTDKIDFIVYLKGVLVPLPAMWIFLGLAIFLTGLLPRLTSLTWVLFVFTFFMMYMGRILQLPDWTNHITPFSNLPDYPVGKIEALPLVVMTGMFVVLAVVGVVAYKKRDLVFR